MTSYLSPAQLKTWLHDGSELAVLDVREHGQYGEAHPFYAVPLPYSRLELDIARLVPRLATRLVLLDDGGEDEAPPVALTERVAFWCEGVVSTKSVESQDNDPSRLSRAKSRDVIATSCARSLDTLGTNGGGGCAHQPLKPPAPRRRARRAGPRPPSPPP